MSARADGAYSAAPASTNRAAIRASSGLGSARGKAGMALLLGDGLLMELFGLTGLTLRLPPKRNDQALGSLRPLFPLCTAQP
ncbi:hypothetical protein GCM10010319_61170 [Streptomyces blastmyceticus]|uniref:Uncharacterized protein n=1 Tax=Streptomyces blastmyceticus TaxID=68180 RepID=A0ABP3HMC2_9ACTN